ncbi:hypothetical protein pb186bvf_005163 [Paramecium bursaria]
MSMINQSFFEPKIDEQDFEIIDAKVFHQVNSLKQDINNKYIVIANNNGFRIYGIEQAKIIEIVEDFEQPIYDMDFINDTILFVLGFEKSIAIWDNLNKRIVQQYPILGQQITQIDYRNPFIMCSFDNNILIINQKTNQAYRYIKYIGNLQKYITYIINRDIYQICLVYLGYESQQIIVDNLTLQNIIAINTKELSKKDYSYDKEISIAYLNKFKQRMLNNSSDINQWNSYCYVGLSDDGNKIAISEFGNSQYIYMLQLNWKENNIQILNTLYRGHSKKELRLFLGQEDLVICLSFEKYKKQNGYDITLHLYYKNDQQNSQSKKRYYLRSWSQHQMELRQKDIIINFLQNEVRMFSSTTLNNQLLKRLQRMNRRFIGQNHEIYQSFKIYLQIISSNYLQVQIIIKNNLINLYLVQKQFVGFQIYSRKSFTQGNSYNFLNFNKFKKIKKQSVTCQMFSNLYQSSIKISQYINIFHGSLKLMEKKKSYISLRLIPSDSGGKNFCQPLDPFTIQIGNERTSFGFQKIKNNLDFVNQENQSNHIFYQHNILMKFIQGIDNLYIWGALKRNCINLKGNSCLGNFQIEQVLKLLTQFIRGSRWGQNLFQHFEQILQSFILQNMIIQYQKDRKLYNITNGRDIHASQLITFSYIIILRNLIQVILVMRNEEHNLYPQSNLLGSQEQFSKFWRNLSNFNQI